jgi:hypothetical protein
MMTSRQVVAVRRELQDYVEEFASELGRSERRHWCGKYPKGLLRGGERKSIEPLAKRVGGDEQALQQFVESGQPHVARVASSPHALLLIFYSLARLRTSKKLCSLPEVRRWLIEALALCLCSRCKTRFTPSGIILDSS